MNSLKYIAKKYKLNLSSSSPIELPDVSRAELAKLFAELGFTRGAQVGTWNGTYTNELCAANDKLKLIGFDLNSKTPRRGMPNNCKLLKMSSLDGAKKVVDASLDFVYLDADSDLASTIANITEWSKKVRSGGIIAGHDFFRYRARTNLHTRDGVIAFTGSYQIHPWFVIGRSKERVRSWFWVNV